MSLNLRDYQHLSNSSSGSPASPSSNNATREISDLRKLKRAHRLALDGSARVLRSLRRLEASRQQNNLRISPITPQRRSEDMPWICQSRTKFRRQFIRSHLNRRAKRKEQEDVRTKMHLDRPYQLYDADNANDGDNGTQIINERG